MSTQLYSVLILRTVLHEMTPVQRQELDDAMMFMADTGIMTREDAIDNVDYDDEPAYEGVKYFTTNETILNILTDIAKKGYDGYSKNKLTIDNFLQEGTI